MSLPLDLPFSLDVRDVSPCQSRQTRQIDETTPQCTPRSKSLDLLRSDAATPVVPRASLDTLATLKGRRISSPMFLNSSTGVQPAAEQLSFENKSPFLDMVDEASNEDRGGLTVPSAETRASTMPRCLNSQTEYQLKTPSRRQKSTDQLRSKFSMSPVQQSKRSKARVSEDRSSSNRPTEGLLSHEGSRSTLGNWSYSLGMAARKLHRSALPRKASDESQATTNMHLSVNDRLVTPEKSKGSLRSAASIASIRRFITPSRRTRKVSTTGLVGSRSKALITVDDVAIEHLPVVTRGSDETGWEDADGRCSREGIYPSQQGATEGSIGPSHCDSFLRVPLATQSKPRASIGRSDSKRTKPRRSSPLSPEFFEQPLQHVTAVGLNKSRGVGDFSEVPKSDEHIVNSQLKGLGDDSRRSDYAGDIPTPPQTDSPPSLEAPPAATSKLKTLQLLARRPFHAFGKKMREMDVSWWSSRNSRGVPPRTDTAAPPRPEQTRLPEMTSPPRRSEDLLSKASPRLCDSSTMAYKSRSVELDRLSFQSSKVVPIRPINGVPYKKRPMLPDAFIKPIVPPQSVAGLPQSITSSRTEVNQVTKPSTGQSHTQPRISDLRHPWMRQLQLPNVSSSRIDSGFPSAGNAIERKAWPSMDVEEPSSAGSIPTLSFTAASITLTQPAAQTTEVEVKEQFPRRPPASLLGQSLPIPPRCGRSRASTISSQSSTTSSPSGKVIVSRRSYGQRLRSPSNKEDAASIRSVGTSILFTESPPGSPGLRKLMSPFYTTRSPSAIRVRSPPTNILLPKYSPHRRGRYPSLQRKPSSAFTDDSDKIDEEEEWLDDGGDIGSTEAVHDIKALRSQLEDLLPPRSRPGFLEMTEATHTLSNLVKAFTGSSGSLSLNASPYKKRDTPEHATSPRGGLYGIMETDELSMSRHSPTHLSHIRGRLTSGASLVSTEANSSFEDSEELQKLLDSIMAADLGNSCDTSGSRCDMALLSPFGSPADYRDSSSTEKRLSREVRSEEQPIRSAPLPPPPKFLLNDRPISPPDSTTMSESAHSHTANDNHTAADNSNPTHWEPISMSHTVSFRNSTLSMVPTPVPVVYRVCSPTGWAKQHTHGDGAGYAPVSIVDSHHSQ